MNTETYTAISERLRELIDSHYEIAAKAPLKAAGVLRHLAIASELSKYRREIEAMYRDSDGLELIPLGNTESVTYQGYAASPVMNNKIYDARQPDVVAEVVDDMRTKITTVESNPLTPDTDTHDNIRNWITRLTTEQDQKRIDEGTK